MNEELNEKRKKNKSTIEKELDVALKALDKNPEV